MSNPNLSLWNDVCRPPRDALKEFNRGGGFRGTSIKPMWLVRRATEVFGMQGTGWGFELLGSGTLDGAPLLPSHDNPHVAAMTEKVFWVLGHVWYLDPEGRERRATSPQYGQTTMVGTNKNGPFTDEEAPKKAMTDAMSKCLSHLGFGADVHMGQWDGCKWTTAQTGAEDAPKPKAPRAESEQSKDFRARIAACRDAAELAAVGAEIKAHQSLTQDDRDVLAKAWLARQKEVQA